MKIAFATNDQVHINAHFGWANKIDVYEVSPDGYQFLNTLRFEGDLKEDGNEDKLVPKIEALADCTIVYVSAIGGNAAARLIKKRITPIKARSEDDKITDLLEQLVKTLKGSPLPWLRKALQQKSSSFVEEEVGV
ncbi:Dinitrogenase iron-molybdenum cofactor biosynthesis [Trichormus variabilis ATCC 29413]|uniref:Dinitrogenase iron-molybdenum cofactor biosynthesis n=3 Tax=Anabaena variabilis TaxID=264691 RepID=Q3M585_TRIV2|nr:MULTISPECIES: nitrogen fixation protein NifX [Nostocaceae]AAA93025.1 NifX2 [Trichormus variabilis ATCC 29413]ABA23851.1 Dinitrogenase iron-molybdenum cofactor biosynthesis [Trichormus variabilis ATCC 29413]MBC1214470.1 nitrogen fixation protein NifX [Trichormus variabilis ARAD]MBC1256227.1 nitrogen fixation protein NifX [Trichormus variabilis V5]MBC1268678.1 nitrogen fixation protein NifX [Trichormus variabilis FSR]